MTETIANTFVEGKGTTIKDTRKALEQALEAAIEDVEFFIPEFIEDPHKLIKEMFDNNKSLAKIARNGVGRQRTRIKELEAELAEARRDTNVWLYTHCKAIGMECKSVSGRWDHDIALFTAKLKAERDAAQSRVRELEGVVAVLEKQEVSTK